MSKQRLVFTALCLGLSLATLNACTPARHASGNLLSGDDTAFAAATGSKEDAQLYSDLIGRLIEQNKLYAAMAHLEERQKAFGDNDHLRVLRADILRKMGQSDQAEAIYKPLLTSDYAAEASHGLGLIYAPEDMALGTRYLQMAVDKDPTSAQMRNDLGYALMRQGKYHLAYTQLATAYQLDEKNQLNENNFIVLLLVMGQDGRAERVAASGGLSSQTMGRLRRKASKLKPSLSGVEKNQQSERIGNRALSLKLSPDMQRSGS